jgi:hypothetical protein
MNFVSGPLALTFDLISIINDDCIDTGGFLKLFKLLTIPGVVGIFQGNI